MRIIEAQFGTGRTRHFRKSFRVALTKNVDKHAVFFRRDLSDFVVGQRLGEACPLVYVALFIPGCYLF